MFHRSMTSHCSFTLKYQLSKSYVVIKILSVGVSVNGIYGCGLSNSHQKTTG